MHGNDTSSEFPCFIGSQVTAYKLEQNGKLATLKANPQVSNLQICNANNCNAPSATGSCVAAASNGGATQNSPGAILGAAIGILLGVILASAAARAYFLGTKTKTLEVGKGAGDVIPNPLPRQARAPTNPPALRPSRVEVGADQRLEDPGL